LRQNNGRGKKKNQYIFSEYEKMLLKQMLSDHPVISKNHTAATEQKIKEWLRCILQ
jgi:hypothetical protein